jgi:N-acetylneuraminic acid mutarotase
MLLDPLLAALEEELRAKFHKALAGLLATARTRLEAALTEVVSERTKALAEVATQKAALRREIEAMYTHTVQQQGRVKLNIGGYHFETSVQTLRRVPHTFFDAYFSGRYSQDVCPDGSIFVDRNGEHFSHVLEYMRDGVVSVARPRARPDVSLLRALKREFGFYSIELCTEPEQVDMAFAFAGAYQDDNNDFSVCMSDMERYDESSGQWSAVASMITGRHSFSASACKGELYVAGGWGEEEQVRLSSVEKYSPSSNTWSAVTQLPDARVGHSSVVVGPSMYVMCGEGGQGVNTTAMLKFDTTLGTWSQLAHTLESRAFSAACAVGSDIYVFGGHGDYLREDSVLIYDTLADTWRELAPMPQGCEGHSASLIDGFVYIVGVGYGQHDGRTVLRYDPLSGVWTRRAPTSQNRQHGCSFLLHGSLYAAGGFESSSVERYDVADNTWTTVADMLESRWFCGAAILTCPSETEEENLFDSLIDKATRESH